MSVTSHLLEARKLLDAAPCCFEMCCAETPCLVCAALAEIDAAILAQDMDEG